MTFSIIERFKLGLLGELGFTTSGQYGRLLSVNLKNNNNIRITILCMLFLLETTIKTSDQLRVETDYSNITNKFCFTTGSDCKYADVISILCKQLVST